MNWHDEKLIEILAHVYAKIDMRKIRLKNIHDVWNHRIRAAATRATLYEAISRLANFFGIQSLPPALMRSLEDIQPYEDMLLDKLMREHIYFSAKSAELGKKIKEERRKQKGGNYDKEDSSED